MFYELSWFFRECAMRDYIQFRRTIGEISDRAYDRAERFLALATLLHPLHDGELDLEWEYYQEFERDAEA